MFWTINLPPFGVQVGINVQGLRGFGVPGLRFRGSEVRALSVGLRGLELGFGV